MRKCTAERRMDRHPKAAANLREITGSCIGAFDLVEWAGRKRKRITAEMVEAGTLHDHSRSYYTRVADLLNTILER